MSFFAAGGRVFDALQGRALGLKIDPQAGIELTKDPPFTERRTGPPQIQNQRPGHPLQSDKLLVKGSA
jgi:hypothetical protein